MLLSPLALAIYLPLQARDAWVNGPIPLVPATLMPVMLVGLTIADSFAGERERHTLPTLLASRLSDRAILIGKIVPSAGLGWAASLLVPGSGARHREPCQQRFPRGHILAARPDRSRQFGILDRCICGCRWGAYLAALSDSSGGIPTVDVRLSLAPPFWRRS